MALFSECMQGCARKVLDTADIVREAIFRQQCRKGPCLGGWPADEVTLCIDEMLRKTILQESWKPGSLMKAIVYHRYGSPDVLRCEEIEKPTAGDNEVLIKVRAASVNPYDWHFMRGTPYLLRMMAGLRKPKATRLGADVAGQVEAVGRNVT